MPRVKVFKGIRTVFELGHLVVFTRLHDLYHAFSGPDARRVDLLQAACPVRLLHVAFHEDAECPPFGHYCAGYRVAGVGIETVGEDDAAVSGRRRGVVQAVSAGDCNAPVVFLYPEYERPSPAARRRDAFVVDGVKHHGAARGRVEIVVQAVDSYFLPHGVSAAGVSQLVRDPVDLAFDRRHLQRALHAKRVLAHETRSIAAVIFGNVFARAVIVEVLERFRGVVHTVHVHIDEHLGVCPFAVAVQVVEGLARIPAEVAVEVVKGFPVIIHAVTVLVDIRLSRVPRAVDVEVVVAFEQVVDAHVLREAFRDIPAAQLSRVLRVEPFRYGDIHILAAYLDGHYRVRPRESPIVAVTRRAGYRRVVFPVGIEII